MRSVNKIMLLGWAGSPGKLTYTGAGVPRAGVDWNGTTPGSVQLFAVARCVRAWIETFRFRRVGARSDSGRRGEQQNR